VQRYLILALVLLFSLSALIQPAQAQGEDWVIEGDKVFIDDANVYLSATPHTLGGSGWVEFELLSKGYEGEIDAIWGFNQSEGIVPSKPQIWAENVPHTVYRLVDVEKEDTLIVTGITSFAKLSWATFEGEPDIGNRNNTHLYEVTADFWGMETETLVVAFNAYVLDGSTATITYNYDTREREYYIEYYDDWKPFNIGSLTTVDREYKGFDDWRFTKLDAPIQKNVTYKVRCWIEVPFKGTTPVSGKYIWAVKPHNESIQDAIASGHLYVLDPWYNGSWSHRLEITIDHTKVDADLVDFPVLITEEDMTVAFWANVKADGTDIVMTLDDGDTKLKRELVDIDTVGKTMELWFKAPTLSSTVDDVFYLYFGNAGAAEVNDADTWDAHYIAVYHLSDDPDNAHVIDSTGVNSGDKTAANEPNEVVGEIGEAQDFDGANDYISGGNAIKPECEDTLTFEALVFDNVWGANDCMMSFGTHAILITEGVAGAVLFVLFDDLGGSQWMRFNAAGEYLTAGIWNQLAGTWDGTDMLLYSNGTKTARPPRVLNAPLKSGVMQFSIGRRGDGNHYFDDLLDEVRVSDIARSEGWIGTGYNTMTDPATFYSVADEALVLPTVETDNADIDGTTATLNGEITDTGFPYDDDERGFVWDTVSWSDPGNVAPGASGYSDNWTEAGSFGVGAFDHDATGLTALVTYYYRACANNPAGWDYGDEITFFALPDGNVYLEFRPDLSETRIRGNAGIPADILVEDMFIGYILPIYDADDQELFFLHCVPDRWDDSKDPVYASHILVHVISSLSDANEANRGYRLQLAWDEATPNEEEIPAYAPNTVDATRMVYSNTQYECYQDWFVVLCNVDDGLEHDDIIALRLRRTLHTDDQKADNELAGNLIIHAVDILYARGDMLGDPDGAGGILTLINIWIEEGIIVGGEDVFFLALIFLAVSLTIATFALRSGRMILSFASAGAWMVLGVYSYTQSAIVWDIYYALFWLSMGMVVCCVLIPAILKEKKEDDISLGETDEFGDKDMLDAMEADDKDRARFERLSGKRKPRRRLSRFAKTGKE